MEATGRSSTRLPLGQKVRKTREHDRNRAEHVVSEYSASPRRGSRLGRDRQSVGTHASHSGELGRALRWAPRRSPIPKHRDRSPRIGDLFRGGRKQPLVTERRLALCTHPQRPQAASWHSLPWATSLAGSGHSAAQPRPPRRSRPRATPHTSEINLARVQHRGADSVFHGYLSSGIKCYRNLQNVRLRFMS